MHDSMFTVPRLLHFFVEIFLFFQVPVVIDQDRLVVKSVQLMKVPQEHPTLTFLR